MFGFFSVYRLFINSVVVFDLVEINFSSFFLMVLLLSGVIFSTFVEGRGFFGS